MFRPTPQGWEWINRTQETIFGKNTPSMNQLQFQWAQDDGTEATSTLLLSPGSDISVDLSAGNANRQLRFVVEETAGFANNNYTDQYQSDLNASATWENVTTTENGDGVLVDTTNLTDRAPSTQRVGTGTFISTNDGQTTDGSPGGPAQDYSGNDEAEMVCAFTFVAASLNDGDTIDFRMGGVDTRTGGSNARVTIVKSADTNVAANPATLTLAEFAAAVALDIDIAPTAPAAFTIATNAATIANDVNVGGQVAALTLTTHQAAIAHDRSVAGAVDAKTITTHAATIDFGANIQASTVAKTIATNAATITHDVNVNAGTAAKTLATNAAGIAHDRNVAASTAALSLVPNAASVAFGSPIRPRL